MIKKLVTGVLAVLLAVSLLMPVGVVRAEKETEHKTEYEPCDVVLVLDTSGSMKSSDRNRLVLKAVQKFANMMPADECRVAVVGFNDVATVYTTENGQPAFCEMSELNSLDKVKQATSAIKYSGYTGIGNGLIEAVNLMKNNEKAGNNKAIILFSDGVDDLRTELKYQECQDNLTDAVLWAKQNECKIYSVGFNYLTKSGSSLGKEGLEKLNFITDSTGGITQVVDSLKGIEDTFIQFVANIFNLNYIPLSVVGGEVEINVTPGVMEMNLRIACDDKSQLKNATISLIDAQGNSVELKNSDRVRYDEEENSISIKVIGPECGKWMLKIVGIADDDIKIGLLNHYDLVFKAYAQVPKGNPENTAYSGDEVKIGCKIESEGGSSNSTIYQYITKSVAYVSPRTNPDKQTEVKLEYNQDANELQGSFKVSETAIHDVSIVVETDFFSKTIPLSVESGNKPLEISGSIANQKVKVKKSIAIDDIYQYVKDVEGDKIEASISNVENAKVASVKVDGDKIIVDGLKWGSTLVTVMYKDAQGNVQTLDFSVQVQDPIKVALLSMIPVIIIIAIVIIVFFALQKTRLIDGRFEIGPVAMVVDGKTITTSKFLPAIDARVLFRGHKTLKAVMKKYATKIRARVVLTEDQEEALQMLFIRTGNRNRLSTILNSIVFKGTFFGKKGFIIEIPKGQPVKLDDQEEGIAVKYKVSNSRDFTLKIKVPDGTEVRINMNYIRR